MTAGVSLLDKLRELGEKATPGPWVDGLWSSFEGYWKTEGVGEFVDLHDVGTLISTAKPSRLEADVELIETLRNALPAVVALVEAAQRLVAEDNDPPMEASPGWHVDTSEVAAALAPFVGEAT